MITKFKRSKNKWINEQEALNDICTLQNVPASDLTAAHTETHFVWCFETQDPAEPGTFAVKKTDSLTEAQAAQAAFESLETFEGNLKTAHTETHFVFSKIR
jgi:hypothetical protein